MRKAPGDVMPVRCANHIFFSPFSHFGMAGWGDLYILAGPGSAALVRVLKEARRASCVPGPRGFVALSLLQQKCSGKGIIFGRQAVKKTPFCFSPPKWD